jgi:hypothetical protein
MLALEIAMAQSRIQLARHIRKHSYKYQEDATLYISSLELGYMMTQG